MITKKPLKNVSIFNRIFLVTIVLILLSTIVSSSFSLVYFTDTTKGKDRLLVKEAAKRIEDFMQSNYNMMYNQRTLLHSAGYIADVLTATRAQPSDIYLPANLNQITNYLTALCYSNNAILDVVIFTADGMNAFSYSNSRSRTIYLGYDYANLPYILEFQEAEEPITVVYDHAPPYLTLSSEGNPEVITFIGKLYDMSSPNRKIITGYLMINFSPVTIDDAYNEIEAASAGKYFVTNNSQDIIYSNDPSCFNLPYRDELLEGNDIVMNQAISLSGLRVIGALSDESLMENINAVIRRTLIITCASILCLVVVLTVLFRYYKHKFYSLASAMERISSGDFNTRLPVEGKDEIGYLSQCFNTMSETLNTYIKKNYLAEIQRRTAELYALRAQINPHFLSNTIESIRMKALSDDNYELEEMLAHLGKLFRWMVEFHEDIVYLEDELDYIEAYLDLQKFRFGDRISIRTNVPPDTLYLGIPKFTIQPLVENALIHGASPTVRTLTIQISLALRTADGKNQLLLTVEDNGVGIPPEALAQLRQHITGQQQDPAFGVALQNVHTRIQLLFGEPYGLFITSRLHAGTAITVSMPALKKEEMENYVQNDHCR